MNQTSLDARDPFLNSSDEAPPGTGMLRSVPGQGAAALRRHQRRRTRVAGPAGAATAATAGVIAALLAGCATRRRRSPP